MQPADDIRRFINESQIAASSQVDRRILADALEDLEKRRADRLARRPGAWRVVMRTRTGKLAAAALVVVGLLVVMQQLGGSSGAAGVAWGDVRDAFLQQHWVHVKYDNGKERWSNLQTGDSYFKNWNGGCVAVDYARNLRQAYEPAFGRHISEDRWARGVMPAWEPKTAWDSVLGHWEQVAQQGRARDWEVERHIDQVGGTPLVRFDCYLNDAAGRRLLIQQIWADPKTRLPLTIRERLQLAEREKQTRESITGTFDFPQTGPASLYDLGVARDLPIVRTYDKVTPPAVQEVLANAQAALARFPSRYRAVVWDNTRESEINVIWHDGVKIRFDLYFNLPLDMHPQHNLVLPANARDVLRWTQTQPPMSTYLFDGEKSYRRHYVHPVYPDSRAEARVLRERDAKGLPLPGKPIEQQWPYANYNPAGFEVITEAPAELREYIGLRTIGTDRHQDFHLDPQHDFICARWIWWQQRSGQWEKHSEEECSDFLRLPPGQWYATRRTVVTYHPDPKRGTVQSSRNWNIDVQLIEETDFPPDTFNGDKLLEGAKLETY
jgi:hypothetical protein